MLPFSTTSTTSTYYNTRQCITLLYDDFWGSCSWFLLCQIIMTRKHQAVKNSETLCGCHHPDTVSLLTQRYQEACNGKTLCHCQPRVTRLLKTQKFPAITNETTGQKAPDNVIILYNLSMYFHQLQDARQPTIFGRDAPAVVAAIPPYYTFNVSTTLCKWAAR